MLATLDPHDFVRHAAPKLHREPPGLREAQDTPLGDHALQYDRAAQVLAASPKPAAVLVPVVLREEEPTMLLTQRASHLRAHSGQIAFPGGRMDEEDGTPLVTALREAEEEIGLDRRFVRAVGYLDPYLASSGYMVTPVVGAVEPDFSLRLNPAEVVDAFEVPLAFLLDPDNHEIHAREWKGGVRQHYAIPFGERYIWGVTAGILRNLYVRLYES